MSGNMLTGLGPATAGQATQPTQDTEVPSQGQSDTGTTQQPIDHAAIRQHVINGWRNADQATALRHRDLAGREMNAMAQMLNDPDLTPSKVTGYIGRLTKEGALTPQEALQIIKSMPKTGDRAALQNWGRMMFAVAMHTGMHLHAAFPDDAFPSGQFAQQAPSEQGGASQGQPEDEEV